MKWTEIVFSSLLLVAFLIKSGSVFNRSLTNFGSSEYLQAWFELPKGHMPKELHPIENILVLSEMSFQSGPSGGTYFWCDLDGACFFHQITSLSLNPAPKNIMVVSQKILKFTCFLVKNQGGKNMGIKWRNLLVKRILLSFP